MVGPTFFCWSSGVGRSSGHLLTSLAAGPLLLLLPLLLVLVLVLLLWRFHEWLHIRIVLCVDLAAVAGRSKTPPPAWYVFFDMTPSQPSKFFIGCFGSRGLHVDRPHHGRARLTLEPLWTSDGESRGSRFIVDYSVIVIADTDIDPPPEAYTAGVDQMFALCRRIVVRKRPAGLHNTTSVT